MERTLPSDIIYRCLLYSTQHGYNERREWHHVVRLKPFEYEEGSDPRLVANQASQTWDVEKILSHTGKPFDSNRNDTKKKITFTVKWVGFDETTEELCTNRSLFKTAAMHDYLRENNLKSLIPAAYKK